MREILLTLLTALSKLAGIGTLAALPLLSCANSTAGNEVPSLVDSLRMADSIAEAAKPDPLTLEQIQIKRDLLYDKYTPKDTSYYQKKRRVVNLDAVREQLLIAENLMDKPKPWGVLQNYKNKNGTPKKLKASGKTKQGATRDSLGVTRSQSIPLNEPFDTVAPVLYARDGSLIFLTDTTREDFWLGDVGNSLPEHVVPKKYIQVLPDSTLFGHVIVIDRTNQNMVTLERLERGSYAIRSINPVTTGRNKPPYAQPTPAGIYLLQEKKSRMLYTHDGSNELAGFAPWANRFTNGAYIHGVPTANVHGAIREYSYSLGTVPLSHMCVRTPSSHSKFIFDNFPALSTLIIVLE